MCGQASCKCPGVVLGDLAQPLHGGVALSLKMLGRAFELLGFNIVESRNTLLLLDFFLADYPLDLGLLVLS